MRPILVVAFLLASVPAFAQELSTIAGTGEIGYSGDGGPATSALLHDPQGIGLDFGGNIYFADNLNFVIRKIDTNGVIYTVAGNGVQGFSGDGGPATQASLGSPVGIHVTPGGDILVADMSNHRVRLVDGATGVITTIAGNGLVGFSGDGGPATGARLNTPQGVAMTGDGDVLIADTVNLRVRRVDVQTGNIFTICGTGFPSSGGDGGPAVSASLTSPRRITVSYWDDIYILDRASNARIRQIDATTGIINTVAGGGALTGDSGPATQMNLGPLTDVDFDGDTIYITASFRLWRVDSGFATAIAGTGTQGFGGDGGDPLLAEFNNISGVIVHGAFGNFLSDRSNQRIRRIGDDFTTFVEQPGAMSATSFSARLAPNPFRLETAFMLTLLAGADATSLLIYDVSGRAVRSLPLGAESGDAAAREVRWDGRDAGGRDLPAGLYFYRVESAGRLVASGRAVRIK